jgi:hypothetical protein
MSDSDLVELAKQSSQFKDSYGKYWGGFIHLQHVNAATGRRPFLWGGLATVGLAVLGLLVRYALPRIFG